MGLDVYVGPLSRYYAGDWETIVQQKGREDGVPVEVLRPPVPRQLQDPERVLAALGEWQRAASSRVSMVVPGGIAWDESAIGEYITDKPDWGPYFALAAVATDDDMARAAPPDSTPQGREAYELWRRLGNRYVPIRHSSFTSRLRHFFGQPDPPIDATPRRYATIVVAELWVPADFPHVLELRDLRGNRVAVGSVDELLRELRLLNDRVLHVDEANASRSNVNPPDSDSVAANAAFGLAVMLDLAKEAVARRLPMVLDY